MAKMRIAGAYTTPHRVSGSFSEDVVRRIPYASLGAGLSRCVIPMGADATGVGVLDWSERHVLCTGITGAGKTESILNSTILLNALNSERQPNLLVIDAKGDCYEKTGHLLAMKGYGIRNIDMRLGYGDDGFNPLEPAFKAFVAGNRATAQGRVRELAESLTSQIEDNKDRYWEKAAASLIEACALCLFETRYERNSPCLGDIADILTRGEPALNELVADCEGTKAANGLRAALSMRGAKETLACVISCALEPLSFYRTTQGHRVTGMSTFDIGADLRGDMPVAYFLCVAGDASDGTHAFGSLLFDLVHQAHVELFYELRRRGEAPRPLRCVFDEFAQFKAVGNMPNVLATARESDFLVMIAVQSTSQLVANYGVDLARVILSQCGIGLFMRSVDEEISKEAASRTDGAITPAHLMDLDTGEAYLVMAGVPTAKARFLPFDEVIERGQLREGAACRRASHNVQDEHGSSGLGYGRFDFAKVLAQCKVALEGPELRRLANELVQHEGAWEGPDVIECAKALADSLELAYCLGFASYREALMDCIPKPDALNPFMSRFYLMVLLVLFETGRKEGFEGVIDDLLSATDAMADYVEAGSRTALVAGDLQIGEGALLVGEALDEFARKVANSDSGVGVVESYKSILEKSLLARMMITRRILDLMAEEESERDTPLMRRVSVPGPEGDRALNWLRAFRVFGFTLKRSYYEELIEGTESQPTLWGSLSATA